MFGSGCGAAPSKVQEVLNSIYKMLPNMLIEAWQGKHLDGELMDNIISMRERLDELEFALLKNNPALGERVEKTRVQKEQ